MRVEDTARSGSVPRTYRALKAVAWIAVSVFYRRVDVTGASHWRGNRPTIVAANHTNALADPAVMLAALPGHPRFLAAGSWWRIAPARWLFRAAGVVPIHRRRDGGDRAANRATFAACHEALASGATLAVFPEGELHHEPSIAPLKTGAARIALGAVADAGVPDVALLPVGIVYEDRGRFRSQVAVQVGRPVPVEPWVAQHRTDPRGAARALTDEVARGLHDVTVNHESWDDLRLIDRAATIALADDRSHERRYARRNELRRGLGAARARSEGREDPAWAALAGTVAAHLRELDALGLDAGRAIPTPDHLARERRRLRAALAAIAPAGAVGAVANTPVALLLRAVGAAVRDPAWQASVEGASGLVICPVVWGAEAVLVRRLGRRAVLGVLVGAPLGGLAWIAWRERRARWRQTQAELVLLSEHPDRLRAAAQARVAIRVSVEQLVHAPRVDGGDEPRVAAGRTVSR